MIIKFRLDGKDVSVEVEPNELLLNVLRDKLGVKAPKYSCGIGECGACTVLLDGEPVLSCLTLAVDANGREVTTASGIKGEEAEMLMKAFAEEGAVQCGFCTPGMFVMSYALLHEKKRPTEDEIREYLRGNLCRCTGYVNIVRGIEKVVEMGGKK